MPEKEGDLIPYERFIEKYNQRQYRETILDAAADKLKIKRPKPKAGSDSQRNMVRVKLLQLTEYEECIILREYLDVLKQQGKIILYSHIPNGTWTPSRSQRLKNKLMGVSPGVPDYIILAKTKAFFIEMKRKKGGKPSDEQIIWLGALTEAGIPSYLASGFDEAKVIIDALIKHTS